MKKLTALLLVMLLLAGCTHAAPAATEPSVAPTAAPTAPPTEAPTDPPETEAPTEPPLEGLAVHFIDVGQADCALLECDGEFALIDSGNAADGAKVLEYLNKRGVQELELVVGTHPHEDHIGGLPHVLAEFPAETIWSGDITYVNSVVQAFLDGAAAQNEPIIHPPVGETFELGDALITVLGPVKHGYENVNNDSLVLRVQYGDVRFLFTGDMEQIAESDLLDSGADVKADVLKVGHHGSYTSTGYRLLREAAPTYAVISCGAANEYHHPHDEPVSRLKDADVIIYRTDRMYNIVAVTDGTVITFTWDNTFAQPWMPAA